MGQVRIPKESYVALHKAAEHYGIYTPVLFNFFVEDHSDCIHEALIASLSTVRTLAEDEIQTVSASETSSRIITDLKKTYHTVNHVITHAIVTENLTLFVVSPDSFLGWKELRKISLKGKQYAGRQLWISTILYKEIEKVIDSYTEEYGIDEPPTVSEYARDILSHLPPMEYVRSINPLSIVEDMEQTFPERSGRTHIRVNLGTAEFIKEISIKTNLPMFYITEYMLWKDVLEARKGYSVLNSDSSIDPKERWANLIKDAFDIEKNFREEVANI